MTGFYPRTKEVYKAKLNSVTGEYEIFYKDTLYRSGISTRRDAINQVNALNLRFGVEK